LSRAKKNKILSLILPLIFLVTFIAVGSESWALPGEGESYVSDRDYKIGSADVLEITVYGEEDLTKEVRVSEAGHITYPLLGQVKVSGLTSSQIERSLTDKLGARFLVNPQVNVFVKAFSKVFVYGEVEKPGAFPLAGRVTVLEAITMAEGLTEVASSKNVKIIRSRGGQKETIRINLDDITKRGEKEKDIVLERDDVVVVSKSFF